MISYIFIHVRNVNGIWSKYSLVVTLLMKTATSGSVTMPIFISFERSGQSFSSFCLWFYFNTIGSNFSIFPKHQKLTASWLSFGLLKTWDALTGASCSKSQPVEHLCLQKEDHFDFWTSSKSVKRFVILMKVCQSKEGLSK